jgi:hypothetical protein
MYKIKTRLPLTAWVLAGLVTASSLLSTLIEHPRSDQTDMAQAVQYDVSGDKGVIAASTTIH